MIRPDARRYAAQFAALGHANRVEIVRLLLNAHPAGLVVGTLQRALEIPPSTLTHHLDALRLEGLVTQTREGRFLRYRTETAVLRGLLGVFDAEGHGDSPGGGARPTTGGAAGEPTTAAGRAVDTDAASPADVDDWKAW